MDLDHEFGKGSLKLPGSQQERVPPGPPSERSLRFGKGLVEKDSARCDERLEPGEEGAVEISKHEHCAKTFEFERRERRRLEVGAAGFDRAGTLRDVIGSDLRDSVEMFAVSIDRENRESEVGRGEGMAAAAASQIERSSDPCGGR